MLTDCPANDGTAETYTANKLKSQFNPPPPTTQKVMSVFYWETKSVTVCNIVNKHLKRQSLK
jgi:hypothetical protein